MKYDFIKSRLQSYLQKMSIDYQHITDLGINSEDRKNLISIQDYRDLFNVYEKEILPTKTSQLKVIYDLLNAHNRVAIMCFESDVSKCHRRIISMQNIFKDNFKIVDL
jgi:uncharacterized protein (DUF488 family)